MCIYRFAALPSLILSKGRNRINQTPICILKLRNLFGL